MQNKVEVIMDADKIKADGKHSVEGIQSVVDAVFAKLGLRKEGNFYIDDDPYDSAGAGMACIFALAEEKWFRNYVKKMYWYRDIRHKNLGEDYHIEDIKADVIDKWNENRIKYGLPIDD